MSLKVCVYAISKNESKFVKRFVDSMSEADEIYVLDTGSTDDTVSLLQKNHVHVMQKEIKPWRFDVARNASLQMVPEDTDICVCTDLDEVFESGWRQKVEKIWKKERCTRLRYLYHWSFDENGNPATTFHINKIHSRKGYFWKYPVHEVLEEEEGFSSKEVVTDEIVLNHYPDPLKSRSSYLPLLEMSVKENPEDDRNVHYLGREYMFYEKWDDAIKTFHRHLNRPAATWKDERCASMRFMARCYYAKGFFEECEMWYKKAILEAPYLREGYVELGIFYYEQKRFEDCYSYLKQASLITKKSKSYINEEFAWNETVYDLLSIACFHLSYFDEAIDYCKKAISFNPKNTRLQENFNFIQEHIKKENSK